MVSSEHKAFKNSVMFKPSTAILSHWLVTFFKNYFRQPKKLTLANSRSGKDSGQSLVKDQVRTSRSLDLDLLQVETSQCLVKVQSNSRYSEILDLVQIGDIVKEYPDFCKLSHQQRQWGSGRVCARDVGDGDKFQSRVNYKSRHRLAADDDGVGCQQFLKEV